MLFRSHRSSHLIDATSDLVASLMPAARDVELRQAIIRARRRALEFDRHGFIDLHKFCQALPACTSKSAVHSACQRLMRAVEDFVISTASAPSRRSQWSRASGVSVYFPKWIAKPNNRSSRHRDALQHLQTNYPQLVFAQRTGWQKFLFGLQEGRHH